MKKHTFEEMEFFSHFKPTSWVEKNEDNLVKATAVFCIGALALVTIGNFILGI